MSQSTSARARKLRERSPHEAKSTAGEEHEAIGQLRDAPSSKFGRHYDLTAPVGGGEYLLVDGLTVFAELKPKAIGQHPVSCLK